MKKTDNIYMDALSYGVENMAIGISYSELKEYLVKKGWKLPDDSSDYFLYWFLTNFYERNCYNALKNENPLNARGYIIQYFQPDKKIPMTAEAFETYQDYEKLKQNRIDTKNAQRTALIAIWISGGLAAVQIILQLISMCK